MTIDDLAYEPTVEVDQVYRVVCDGGCSWEWISSTVAAAEIMARDHRDWHRKIINALESGTDPCESCGSDDAPKLAEGRYGGLPYLYCGTCGAGL